MKKKVLKKLSLVLILELFVVQLVVAIPSVFAIENYTEQTGLMQDSTSTTESVSVSSDEEPLPIEESTIDLDNVVENEITTDELQFEDSLKEDSYSVTEVDPVSNQVDKEMEYSLQGDTKSVINFPDKNLENAVKSQLGLNQTENVTTENIQKLGFLTVDGTPISSLTGLENAKNLFSINIYSPGTISDLSPLKNLTQIDNLDLRDQNISDISVLSNLPKLKYAKFEGNNISNLAPLSNLKNLYAAKFKNNNISDVTPLKNLISLNLLDLEGNSVTDISSLANLVNLTQVNINQNNVSNITVLKNFKNLKFLDMEKNHIVDLSPLNGLSALSSIYAKGQIVYLASDVATHSKFIEKNIVKPLDKWNGKLVYKGFNKNSNVLFSMNEELNQFEWDYDKEDPLGELELKVYWSYANFNGYLIRNVTFDGTSSSSSTTESSNSSSTTESSNSSSTTESSNSSSTTESSNSSSTTESSNSSSTTESSSSSSTTESSNCSSTTESSNSSSTTESSNSSSTTESSNSSSTTESTDTKVLEGQISLKEITIHQNENWVPSAHLDSLSLGNKSYTFDEAVKLGALTYTPNTIDTTKPGDYKISFTIDGNKLNQEKAANKFLDVFGFIVADADEIPEIVVVDTVLHILPKENTASTKPTSNTTNGPVTTESIKGKVFPKTGSEVPNLTLSILGIGMITSGFYFIRKKETYKPKHKKN
ncbi:leucine-rich repeat domain-containing protein [Enterococcus crotali]